MVGMSVAVRQGVRAQLWHARTIVVVVGSVADWCDMIGVEFIIKGVSLIIEREAAGGGAVGGEAAGGGAVGGAAGAGAGAQHAGRHPPRGVARVCQRCAHHHPGAWRSLVYVTIVEIGRWSRKAPIRERRWHTPPSGPGGSQHVGYVIRKKTRVGHRGIGHSIRIPDLVYVCSRDLTVVCNVLCVTPCAQCADRCHGDAPTGAPQR
eukprot:1190181-Prorocentrum_minimum.AAC.4